MKRRWLFTGAILVCAVIAALFFYPRERVSTSSYRMIQMGMSFDQVIAAIGEPGLYCDKGTLAEAELGRAGSLWEREHHCDASEGDSGAFLNGRDENWYGPGGQITVVLDENGRVVYKAFTRFERSFWNRIFAGPGAWFGG